MQPPKKRIPLILEELARAYPEAICALHHESPFQLLIATILSAQCTDARVNEVTPGLFRTYPDPQAFARASLEDIEQAIHSTGFFRNKARNIQACCQALVDGYNGKVPSTMEDLTQLAGVGRKTANVILGNCFGVPGIVVDTHVQRVSCRLGLTDQKDPEKIERGLAQLIPDKEQVDFCHRLILHGRQVCQARKPQCVICCVEKLCPRIGVLP